MKILLDESGHPLCLETKTGNKLIVDIERETFILDIVSVNSPIYRSRYRMDGHMLEHIETIVTPKRRTGKTLFEIFDDNNKE